MPAAGSRLQFGEGGCSSCPVKGTSAYGPLQRPAGLHFSYFFIWFEQDQKEATELYSWFVNTDSHMRLGRFMRVLMKRSHNRDIVLSDDVNPEQQVARRLEEMTFSREVTYCALFIRPVEKAGNGGSRRKLHSRIMELLLHRGVLVQQVNAAELQEDFTEPSRTLGFDLVARMGGTPWRPMGNGQPDPVVGFALHKSGDMYEPDSGAAVFFVPGGIFAGANIFDPADVRAWGGLSMEFFQKWDSSFHTARRLVIHCERPLKTGEMESLKRMVAEVKPGLQVAVVAVRRCRSRDLQAFDSSTPDALPAPGTWVRCSDHRYLLYTHGYCKGTNSRQGQAVPLKINFQFINAGAAAIEKGIPELLNQVYCFSLMHPPSSARHPLPVTLTYPALLARRMELFRGKALPEFGRNIPWFL